MYILAYSLLRMRVNGRTGRRKAGKIIKLKLALTVGFLFECDLQE